MTNPPDGRRRNPTPEPSNANPYADALQKAYEDAHKAAQETLPPVRRGQCPHCRKYIGRGISEHTKKCLRMLTSKTEST